MKSFWGLVVLCCWVGAGWAANEHSPGTTKETILRWVEDLSERQARVSGRTKC